MSGPFQASYQIPAAYPLAAVVGQDEARLALLLVAVDPMLKGALIASVPGAAKSTLARAIHDLLPESAASRFVELPLNATEDRLIGGLDIERTLREGRRCCWPGLLAEADGGLLYVDDVNLLDNGLANALAAALDAGCVRVEREGLSLTHPADFLLVGTYNPDEGEPSLLLKDRVALFVNAASIDSIEDRREILDRVAIFEKDPARFCESFTAETEAIKSRVERARARLLRVEVSKADIRRLTSAAIKLGVEGNRADIFAMRAARASAALAGRSSIDDDDVLTAIRLVLMPRATRMPEPREEDTDRAYEAPEAPEASSDSLQAEDSERAESPSLPGGDSESGAVEPVEDLIIQAADARITDQVLARATCPRSSGSGKRALAADFKGGRYVRASDRPSRYGRIALDATLRAAAPFQRSRKAGRASPRVKVTADDLRFKKFKRKSGMLFIFAVDASGSMALNRMAQAKGALTRLLEESYLYRDKVALVSFRGEAARVLLPPTRSVELAKRLIDSLPAGGATPMAAGLLEALRLAKTARARDKTKAMLVVFTDGRANVGLHTRDINERAARFEAVRDELARIGAALEAEGVTTIMVDTMLKFTSGGDAGALADLIKARYLYLPRAGAEAIYDAVAQAATSARD
jgi:magnesium chelatase subunit D